METNLPKALQAKKDEFLATKIPLIYIEPFETEENLSFWTSKYRGNPYFPKGDEYPKAIDGRYLVFIAQINFSELPTLPGYPEEGILQFFISDNDLYGLEEYTDPYNNEEQFILQQTQNYFRVVYYPEIITDDNLLVTSFDFLPNDDELWGSMPVMKPCRLEFSSRDEFAGLSNYQFKRIFGSNTYDFLKSITKEESEELFDSKILNKSGNKIGGYSRFSQSDILELAPEIENWLLLLQIDRAENADIVWGDGGTGNFFIEENDLKNLDFSRVVYNWDCG
jgi:uncharacterized protein YwqG